MTDLIASYKEDFDNNTCQAPFVRNGYVYYVCTSDALESRTDKLEMIATYIATHRRGCISVHALQKKACKFNWKS
jgi:Mg2+ and Co2+ transporter CorA